MRDLYLDSDFRQVDLHGELLPAVDVRVVGLLEGSLQLVQLVRCEGGPVPPVLLLVGVILPVHTRAESLLALHLALHPVLVILTLPALACNRMRL